MAALKKRRWKLMAALLVAAAGFLAACATPERDVSARPWNAPRGWEHGIPTGLMEGR
jgi:hypothetical protein